MNRSAYDVCIVGAGVAGALIAYELAKQGVKVIMFDAGPRYKPVERYKRMQRYLRGENPWKSNNPARDVFTSTGDWEYPLGGTRIKAVGGSTHHWGGAVFRHHESDFKMKSLYGIAEDWPISYSDLEPYYAKAERELGVAGSGDDPFASSYRSTDYPLPAFPFSYADKKVIKPACDTLGIRLHPVSYARNSIPYQNRPACQAFGVCSVCPIEAMYNADVHVRMAEQVGGIHLLPDTSVLRFNLDSARRIKSVSYAGIDKVVHEMKSGVFVLSSHAVESVRLLLLSKSEYYPNGLANHHGLVGRYFMEHLGTGMSGEVKEKLYPHRIGFYTAQSLQFYNTPQRDRIGAIQFGFASGGLTTSRIASQSSKWGLALKREIRESFGRVIGIAAIVEQLPSEDNWISLDDTVRDYFGNPAPQVHLSVGEYERRTLKQARSIILKILRAMEAKIDFKEYLKHYMNRFHPVAHHMGGCRMGNDSQKSVVDRNLKAHGVDNLFIVGSSVFVTGGAANPTLTIAALSLRAAEHILKALRAGHL